jgi:hypothetical protein
VVFGGAVAVVLGSFLPWASVLFVSVSGIETSDGKATAALGAVTAVVALLVARRTGESRAHIASLLLGLVAGAIAAYDLADISSTEFARVGGGLYLTLAGAVAIVVGGIGALATGSAAPADARVVPVSTWSAPTVTPGWYPDPSGRFDVRYHDGHQWTRHVATGAAQGNDGGR